MQTGPAFLGAPVSHTLGPKRAAVPGQDCLEPNTSSRATSRKECEGAHLWGGLQRGKTILTEVTTEWGGATHSAGTRSPFTSPVKSGDTPAWASGASPEPGRPSLHISHAKGPRGASRSRSTRPLLTLPGRPGSLQRAPPRRPLHPSPREPASLRGAPCGEAWAAKRRPNSPRPPRLQAGAAPLPPSPSPAPRPPCGEKRHPRLKERSSRAREGWEGRTGLTCFMYMVPRPEPGRRPPAREPTTRQQDQVRRLGDPSPQSAALSPLAKQNGGAQGGGVPASDGTTLAAPKERRGNQSQICSFFLEEGALLQCL